MRFETSLFAGALLAASPLQAAQPLDLSWQAPAGCPQEGAVREQIRALVPASMLESGNLKAEGTITRADKRYRLKLILTFGNVRGERVIDSDSCGDLAGAAAVALGLLLQSTAQTSATAPSNASGAGADSADAGSSSNTRSTPDGASATAPASSQARPPDARATLTSPSPEPKLRGAEHPRRWRIFLHAPELALGWGPLPNPTIGAAFALGFSVRPWLLGLGVQLPREQRLTLPGSSRAGADLDYWMAEAWACRGWRAASLELAPCLTFGVERLSATGTGSGVSPLSERATWLSVGGAAHGRWYVAEWFALSATAGVRIEGARPSIRIDGLPDYGRLKPAAFTLQAGPVWIF